MDHSNLVIESQADWITASYRGSQHILRGQELAEGLQATELDLGGQPTYGARFLGVPLQRVGRVAFGATHDVGWLQLSGQVAADCLDVVLATSTKVTRLDIAATFQTPDLDDGLGERAFDEACTWAKSRSSSPKIRFQTDSKRGSSLYIGDRTSDRLLRLYNKQRESESRHDQADVEHYLRCWRAELELKKSVAEPTARRLASSSDRAAFVQATVAEYLHAHGVACALAPTDRRVLVAGFKRRSDADSRLAYLQTHVRPTITWLVDRGHLPAVREALGLTGVGAAHE